jgi:hypothetical protein
MHANMGIMKTYQELGTGANLEAYSLIGNLPVHNFRDGQFPNAERIGAAAIRDTMRIIPQPSISMKAWKVVLNFPGLDIE